MRFKRRACAQAAAEKYGAEKIYTDYRELLADPVIEAVSICTWNNTHAEISIAALNAGKHVLVEKPLCRTVEDALLVQEAVEQIRQAASSRLRPPVRYECAVDARHG
jgi:predicted dehydrogenase